MISFGKRVFAGIIELVILKRYYPELSMTSTLKRERETNNKGAGLVKTEAGTGVSGATRRPVNHQKSEEERKDSPLGPVGGSMVCYSSISGSWYLEL